MFILNVKYLNLKAAYSVRNCSCLAVIVNQFGQIPRNREDNRRKVKKRIQQKKGSTFHKIANFTHL